MTPVQATATAERSRLIEDYFEAWRRLRAEDGESEQNRAVRGEGVHAALDQIAELVWDDPEAVLAMAIEIAERGAPEDDLRQFAAGPLEDLLHSDEACGMLDRIEGCANRNPAMRVMLSEVCASADDMPAARAKRLRRLGCKVA